jgi:hypothetical protein
MAPCNKCICLPTCRTRFKRYPYRLNGVYALIDICPPLDEYIKIVKSPCNPDGYKTIDYNYTIMNEVSIIMSGKGC